MSEACCHSCKVSTQCGDSKESHPYLAGALEPAGADTEVCFDLVWEAVVDAAIEVLLGFRRGTLGEAVED